MWRLMSKGLMGTGAIRDGVEDDVMMGVETGSPGGFSGGSTAVVGIVEDDRDIFSRSHFSRVSRMEM